MADARDGCESASAIPHDSDADGTDLIEAAAGIIHQQNRQLAQGKEDLLEYHAHARTLVPSWAPRLAPRPRGLWPRGPPAARPQHPVPAAPLLARRHFAGPV